MHDEAPLPDRLEWRDATEVDEELLEVATWVNVNALRHRFSREDVRADAHLAAYVTAFGTREGDLGIVAQTDRETVGVAWTRLFPVSAPGYGFVGEGVPEVSVCVFEAYRRQGVGSALLRRLVDRLRAEGHPGVSLSVEDGNGAVELYQRLGWRTIGTDGNAETMLLDLRA